MYWDSLLIEGLCEPRDGLPKPAFRIQVWRWHFHGNIIHVNAALVHGRNGVAEGGEALLSLTEAGKKESP